MPSRATCQVIGGSPSPSSRASSVRLLTTSAPSPSEARVPAAPPNWASRTRGRSCAEPLGMAVESRQPDRRLVAKGYRQRVLQMGAAGHRRVAIAPGEVCQMAAHRRRDRLDQRQPVADLQHHGGVHDVLGRRTPMQPAPGLAGALGELADQWQDRVADILGLALEPREVEVFRVVRRFGRGARDRRRGLGGDDAEPGLGAGQRRLDLGAAGEKGLSPNTARIAAVPNMSAKIAESRMPIAIGPALSVASCG